MIDVAKNDPQFQQRLEEEIIGCILINPQVLYEIEDVIKPEFFYYQAHKKVMTKILELYHKQRTQDINAVTLLETFQEAGISMSEVSDITTRVVTTAAESTRYYAEQLQARFAWRKATAVLQSAAASDEGVYSHEDVLTRLDSVQGKLQQIADQQAWQGEITTTTDVLKNVTERILKNEPIPTLKTGISRLDRVVGGFQKDELIVLAGRTAMGKTAVSLSFLENFKKQGKKIVYFSLEMSSDAMVTRMLASVGRINMAKFKITDQNERLMLTDDDIYKITKATEVIDSYPGEIFWEDKRTTVEEVKSKIRKLKREQNIDGVIIDYLSLISPTYPQHNPNEQLTHTIRTLKLAAKELNIPIIALAQINRGPEMRADKRPLLSDLKDSGNIEQEADMVIMLYRDAYYNEKPDDAVVEELEFIVAKSRNGVTGTVKAGYIGEFVRVVNLEDRKEIEF